MLCSKTWQLGKTASRSACLKLMMARKYIWTWFFQWYFLMICFLNHVCYVHWEIWSNIYQILISDREANVGSHSVLPSTSNVDVIWSYYINEWNGREFDRNQTDFLCKKKRIVTSCFVLHETSLIWHKRFQNKET